MALHLVYGQDADVVQDDLSVGRIAAKSGRCGTLHGYGSLHCPKSDQANRNKRSKLFQSQGVPPEPHMVCTSNLPDRGVVTSRVATNRTCV